MAVEKHEPVIKIKGNKVEVIVGEVIHPMSEAHLIEWIEVEADGQIQRKELSASDEPKAVFEFDFEPKKVIAREHCNLHGTWESKI